MFWRKARFIAPSMVLLVCLVAPLSITAFESLTVPRTPTSVDDVKGLLRQAQKQSRKGRTAEAESLYKQIIEADPANTEAKIELAYLIAKERRVREAYDLVLPIVKEEPKNARAFAVFGATFLIAGRFPEARACFIKSLTLSRREDLAWAGLGMLDFYENQIDESIANLEEATFREPDDPDYQFALGQVAARAERYAEAAAAYKRFLVISSDLDKDRRDRIKGLVNFLNYLGQKTSLYTTEGADQTTVPIKLMGNRPIIQVRINGHDDPLNFVLDTGSGISVISDKTARRFKINPITKGGFARGIGGDGKFEIVYGFLREISLGDVRVRSVPVYIRHFHTMNEDIDGYIGLSLISKFLTTLDYGNLTFALTKRSTEPASALAASENVSLPLRLTSSGFLSGEVKLEGIEDTLNFIVDTGASVSVISDDVAKLQTVRGYERGEKMRVIGSAGVTDDVPSFLLPRVTFGNHSREDVTVIALDLNIINEASGFQQAGILGGNFLRNYRLTFDFKNSKVTFVPVTK